jgi:hypothetical protein
MLDELAQKGTPWPGAPVQGIVPRELPDLEGLGEIFPDEWTIPDDWRLPENALSEDHPPVPKEPGPAYPKGLEDLPVFTAPPSAPALPKVFVPPPGEQPESARTEGAATGGSHE